MNNEIWPKRADQGPAAVQLPLSCCTPQRMYKTERSDKYATETLWKNAMTKLGAEALQLLVAMGILRVDELLLNE